jgi:hypothetical protein
VKEWLILEEVYSVEFTLEIVLLWVKFVDWALVWRRLCSFSFSQIGISDTDFSYKLFFTLSVFFILHKHHPISTARAKKLIAPIIIIVFSVLDKELTSTYSVMYMISVGIKGSGSGVGLGSGSGTGSFIEHLPLELH